MRSLKILAFRITYTSEGDAGNLPGMLDQTLNRLGVPLEDRGAEPDISVEMDSTPANENPIETITEYACDCGCYQTISREKERRISEVENS